MDSGSAADLKPNLTVNQKNNNVSMPSTQIQKSNDIEGKKINEKTNKKTNNLKSIANETNVDEISIIDNNNCDSSCSDDHEIKPQGLKFKGINKYRLIAAFCSLFAAGIHDSVPGELLPHIEDYYDISYGIVSLIWVGSAVGFILVAIIGNLIHNYLGTTKNIILGNGCIILMSLLIMLSPPFPVIVVGFFFSGFGLATNLTEFNMFVSLYSKNKKYLGYLHASYGIGGIVAPLVGNIMTSNGIKWSYFYFILLGLSVFNLCFSSLTLKGCEKDLKQYKTKNKNKIQNSNSNINTNNNTNYNEANSIGNPEKTILTNTFDKDMESNETRITVSKRKNPKAAYTNKNVWLVSLFDLFYQGAEVAIGGWIVTFIMKYRNGDIKKIGYIASGYWGGLTVSRIFLTSLISKYGGWKRGITILGILSIFFELLTWLIPNIIANGITVALAGMSIGPIIPLLIAFSVNEKIISKDLQVVGLTMLSAFGAVGGALFPFIIGIISQSVDSTFIVHPVSLALFVVMLISWFLLPNLDRITNDDQKKSLFIRIVYRIW